MLGDMGRSERMTTTDSPLTTALRQAILANGLSAVLDSIAKVCAENSKPTPGEIDDAWRIAGKAVRDAMRVADGQSL